MWIRKPHSELGQQRSVISASIEGQHGCSMCAGQKKQSVSFRPSSHTSLLKESASRMRADPYDETIMAIYIQPRPERYSALPACHIHLVHQKRFLSMHLQWAIEAITSSNY